MGFWQHYDGRFGEVVIGHTPGPHVRHLPHIVMVDTGACYGGDLSAYCPETRAVIAVPGLRPDAPRPLPGLRAPSRDLSSSPATSLSRC
jgi:serine/threonine protein phosphatase 1